MRELTQLVLDFAREMNDLQNVFHPQIRDPGRDAKQIFQQYRTQADQIYTRYLTQRKRSCYYGISCPPFFCGVIETAEFTVERSEKRAVVTVCTEVGSLDFQFNLAFQKGSWLINSFKQRYRSQDRSRADKWQYGNF